MSSRSTKAPAGTHHRRVAGGPQGRFAPLRGGLRPSLTAARHPAKQKCKVGTEGWSFPSNKGMDITLSRLPTFHRQPTHFSKEANIWWTIAYQTGVSNSWPRTQKLRCSTGTLTGLAPYSVNDLVAVSGLNPGKLLGVGFCIDSYPGSASPATAPLEGKFNVYVDGSGTACFTSSGTEDYIGLAGYFGGYDQSRILANPNSIQSGLGNYSGVTFIGTETWRGYHFHIMDQIVFENALTVTWDAGETSANGGVNFTGTVKFSYCVWYYMT